MIKDRFSHSSGEKACNSIMENTWCNGVSKKMNILIIKEFWGGKIIVYLRSIQIQDCLKISECITLFMGKIQGRKLDLCMRQYFSE